MLTISAHHASASEAGDYFQVLFEERSEEEGAPYLLIQRQFEDEDGDVCYLESHDQKLGGHFRVRSARLGRRRFVISVKQALGAEVALDIDEQTFHEIERVLRIMIPHLEVSEERLCEES